MAAFICGLTTAIVGAILIVAISIVGFSVVPGIIENMVINEVVLIDDSIQMERFERVPIPLNFTVRVFNISNVDEVLNGGVPIVTEIGPYIYRTYQTRVIQSVEEDQLTYRIVFDFEFDSEGSYPLTEDDLVTVVNVPYHAILQVAEEMFPGLMPILSMALDSIFGSYNSPIIEFKVADFFMNGIRICDNPGLIGAIACTQVRSLSENAQNLEAQDDGSLLFSLLAYRNGKPSPDYTAHRGLENSNDLGLITAFNNLEHLLYWVDGEDGRGSGQCNMINGTDSGLFSPFVDQDQSLFALNLDICRSVELRYQRDLEYEGIPAKRFSANEFFLDNHQGCFCLNVTRGINRDDGCLLRGAQELFTCVGSYLVLTYPHFLYADPIYRNGVLGMNPIEEDHRIYVDLEENTGTIVRGAKRAQFNIFMRPIIGIPATQGLRTTLTPIIWVEEGMSLPEEFVDELRTRLLVPLNLVNILIPILLAVCCIVFLGGIFFIVRAKTRKTPIITTSTPLPVTPETKSS